MRTRLWLLWHSRHGTGPMLKTVPNARALDRHGVAVGPAREVRFYRCECKATRRAT